MLFAKIIARGLVSGGKVVLTDRWDVTSTQLTLHRFSLTLLDNLDTEPSFQLLITLRRALDKVINNSDY